MNKIINKRIQLEKKYCNICLYHKIPLEQINSRVLAISHSGYFFILE